MAFNPDDYIKRNSQRQKPQGFDPDAYLRARTEGAQEPQAEVTAAPADAPQGPPNPFATSATSSPQEMATNRRLAEQQGVPVVSGTDASRPKLTTTEAASRARGEWKGGRYVPPENPPFLDDVGELSSSAQFVRSAGVGGRDAITLGFADEIGGYFGAGATSGKAYEQRRDEIRKESDEARAASPGGYALGQFGGGLTVGAALPAMGTVGNMATGAALGAAQAVGESRASDRGTMALEGLVGGVVGGVAGAAGSALTGGKAADAAARSNQRVVDDLGLRATKTQRNNIALVGRRYANESADMAAVADDIDDAMREAIEEANAIASAAPPVSARDAAKAGAKQAAVDKRQVQKTIANLAKETGLDPFASKPTELAGAAAEVIRTRGERIGQIDEIVNQATGGIKASEVKQELQNVAKKYARTPGKLARARRENVENLIMDFDDIYAPGIVRDQSGVLVAPGPQGPVIPVPAFRSTKSAVAKSAYVGNAAANPSLAKEGEQEIAAALNRVLRRHIEQAGRENPAIADAVAELPRLNKEFSFAKAVEGAANYRAMGEVNSETGLRDIMKQYGSSTGQVRAFVQDATRPIAQKRDDLISRLMELGESESEAKRLAAKISERLIRGTPQGIRSLTVEEGMDLKNRSQVPDGAREPGENEKDFFGP